jgi:hypothetical protein
MASPRVADGGTASSYGVSCGQITRGGPPAWGLGVELTAHRNKNCYEQFTQASDLDGFFGQTIQATEYGYEIWTMECKEFVSWRGAME